MHNHPSKEKFRGKECGNDIRFLILQLNKENEHGKIRFLIDSNRNTITQKLFPILNPAKIGVKAQSFLPPIGTLKNGV